MGVNAHNFIDYGGVTAWNILTCSFLLTYLTTLIETALPKSVCYSAHLHNTLSAGFSCRVCNPQIGTPYCF